MRVGADRASDVCCWSAADPRTAVCGFRGGTGIENGNLGGRLVGCGPWV